MTKVFDDAAVARAFREAAEALRRSDPDTLAGRFSPARSHRGRRSPCQPRRPSAPSPAGETARAFHDETLPKDAHETAHFGSMCGPIHKGDDGQKYLGYLERSGYMGGSDVVSIPNLSLWVCAAD